MSCKEKKREKIIWDKKGSFILSIFFNHNAIRLEINYRTKPIKNTQTGGDFEQYVTKQTMDHQRIERGSKKIPGYK